MEIELRNKALKLAYDLDHAERAGANDDDPESMRYVMVSDTAMHEITKLLRELAIP